MSPNRKADLQRKLSMAPIPKPPAGLAERIKGEIPQHLLIDARKERQRLSHSVVFNLRIAASVILLVSSVYLALHVLSRAERESTRMEMEKPSNVVAERKAPPQQPAAAPARVADAAPPVPKTLAVPPPQKPVLPPVDKKRVLVAEAKPEPLAKEERDAVEGGSAMAGNAAPPPAAIAPAPPPVSASEAAAAPRASAKVMGGLLSEATAASISLAPSMLFDIVVPSATAKLDGEALIEHFAAPAAPPQALRVDAEATMLDTTPLLRVSVDTPEVRHAEGGSKPPIGADATLDIVFNDDAVASHRSLAGTTSSNAPALPSGTSVTALFVVELKPDLARRTTIATVTLRYRSVADGKEHVVTRKLRRADVRTWEETSRRMKSASLAAALVESLETPASIAEKARAAGLGELAAVAERR